VSATEPAASGRALSSLRASGRAALRDGLDTAAHWLGLSDTRRDRAPALLTIHLGAPAGTGLIVIDRRAEEARSHRLDPAADDFGERLAAIRGGQAGVRAKILVDPAYCFVRTLNLPSAVLPRMRAVLAQELEAATPFRAESVHSDWYVEGEDAQTRTIRVRHVVLKRTRLDPLLAALAQAGIAAGPVTVGGDEARSLPLDLLTGGHRALQSFTGGSRGGDLALIAGALLLLLGAFCGFRRHQEATLAALDAAFTEARRASGPAVQAPLRAGAAAILAGHAPPVAETWDALAQALPDTVAATSLRLDAESAYLTLTAPDEATPLAALAHLPGFAAPSLRLSQPDADGRLRLLFELPRAGRGARP